MWIYLRKNVREHPLSSYAKRGKGVKPNSIRNRINANMFDSVQFANRKRCFFAVQGTTCQKRAGCPLIHAITCSLSLSNLAKIVGNCVFGCTCCHSFDVYVNWTDTIIAWLKRFFGGIPNAKVKEIESDGLQSCSMHW